MSSYKVILLFALVSAAHSQSDGSFWWMNKGLQKSASESRSINDQSAKIRTLPPRYRKESGGKISTTTTARTSIFTSEEDEGNHMFKYDSEPDCVCTPKYLCNENNTIITDGNGVIDERSYNICGVDNVCCRVQKTTDQPSTTAPTTTRKNFLDFNLSNITNIISTILKPVTTFDNQPAHKCNSRKGNKIEKRILFNDDDYEDDDSALVGEAAFSEYPWMIEILKKNRKTGSYEYKCGGVLISPTIALTVNHCFKGSSIKPADYLIRAGEWDRSSTLEFAPHHDRQVARIIAHPNYYSGGLHNDIAIIKWSNPLEPEVNVAPICLPDEKEVFAAGTYCTVTGWGKTSDEAPTTDRLKFVKIPIVNHATCQNQFQNNRLGRRFRLHDSFICAGGEQGLDSCLGDGGSPLICPRPDGSFVLAGLVSWGLECGQINVPGAYTNVHHFLKWIKNNEIN